MPAGDEKRVIDSDEVVRKRLEKIMEVQERSEGAEGFVSGLIPAEVLEAPEDGSNIIKAQDEAREILDRLAEQQVQVNSAPEQNGPVLGGMSL